jgi:hypothetical protein
MGMNKPDIYFGWNEPESAANTDYPPVYPYNNVTQTKSGHMFELDDTKGRERVRLQHRANTFLEMHPNGDEVHKIWGDGYVITLGDHNISIGVEGGKPGTDGNIPCKLNITVYGDVNMHVTGDKTETIDGSVTQHIKGNYTQTVEGMSTIASQGNMYIEAGSGATGKLDITTGLRGVSLDGTLRVKGEVAADKIFSFGRIDTGPTGGIGAGALGFVTALGGLSIGIPAGAPVAVPGNILCIGTINATGYIASASLMTAPFATFATMKAGLMTDTINKSIYNLHMHIGNLGYPTSPALTPMV